MATEQEYDPEPISATEDQYKQWWWRQWRNDAFVEQFRRTHRPIFPDVLKPGDPYLIVNAGRRLWDDDIRIVGTFSKPSGSHDMLVGPLRALAEQLKLTFGDIINLNHGEPVNGNMDFMAIKMPVTDPWIIAVDSPEGPQPIDRETENAYAWNPETGEKTSLWVVVPTNLDDDEYRISLDEPVEIYPLAQAISDFRSRHDELSARQVATQVLAPSMVKQAPMLAPGGSNPPDKLPQALTRTISGYLKRRGGRRSVRRRKSRRKRGKSRRRRGKSRRRRGKSRRKKNKIIIYNDN